MAIRRLRTSVPKKGGSNDNSSSNSDEGKSVVWKILSLVAFGLVILMATDAIELKLSVGSSEDGKASQEFGAGVEQKPKHDDDASNKAAAGNTGDSESTPGGDAPVPAPTAVAAADPTPTAMDPVPVEDPPVSAPVAAVNTETPPVPGNTDRVTYNRRGQPMSDADRQAMITKWGSWTLVDTKERPKHDFYKEYPNRDVPRDKFPSNAWQMDKEYLAKFLPESLALVQRAQDAILAEYGKTEGTFEERNKMFAVQHLTKEELLAPSGGLEASGRRGAQNGIPSTYQGGWTTTGGWEGLKRRMLHAVMTEDNFVFAMGGHSAAAGHGNHFQQSYTLQVQWILEAVFARMGVRHQARNFGSGGLGTLQHGMAAGSCYGPDVDVLMWDSSMTENEDGAPDAMARQQIMGGLKVPAVWTLRGSTAKMLTLDADADAGYVGTASSGIDLGSTLEEIQAMPWAMQYVKCGAEMNGICRENEYMGRCWIDRDDYTPTTAQSAAPGGRASWHPGNRKHQVTGRVLAMVFLQALKEALTEWNDAAGFELSDDAWHLTERYDKIRNNVKGLADDVGWCHQYEDNHQLGYICKHAIKGRTEFTPRAYPAYSSIRELMRPEMREIVGEAAPNVYNPPDLFNPDLHPPPGAVDVLSIVEAGVDFQSALAPDYHTDFYKKPKFPDPPKVPLGKGPSLNTYSGDAFCDGSVDSFCNRNAENSCLLYAHNDGRNGILVDQVSGWIAMNIPDLKNGYIAIKIESWHGLGDIPRTEGWTTINNERRLRSSHAENSPVYNSTDLGDTSSTGRRGLKAAPPDYCDDFMFDFAIDGKVTTWNKDEFQANLKQAQRVVEIVTLLNEPGYTGGTEKEVELAFQIRGCPRPLSSKVFKLTHVYWS